MGDASIKNLVLNSIKDNKKFEIDSIELLYSLPLGSFTLINDEKNNIYLVKVKNIINQSINSDNDQFKEYLDKENANAKKNILKSYDLFLNEKYNVVLNQKTIERVKNFFQ
jgi:peptidyl-prolyl cis-trans isomerase D